MTKLEDSVVESLKLKGKKKKKCIKNKDRKPLKKQKDNPQNRRKFLQIMQMTRPTLQNI